MSQSDIESRFAAGLPDIRNMGLMIFDPIWAERDHDACGCEIMYVLRGAIELHMGGRRFRAGPGDILLVPAGATHRDCFDVEEGIELFFCSFTWAPAKEYFAIVTNDIVLGVPDLRKGEIAAEFHHLRADLTGDARADRLVARGRIHTILLLLLREALAGEARPDAPEDLAYGPRRRKDLMRRACEWMDRNYARGVTLDEIASALRVSAYYLSHVFSQESDFSLFSHLTRLRMNKAGELLLAERLNVSEVARSVGYEDPNYFSKVFKKRFGCSPSRFRAARLNPQ